MRAHASIRIHRGLSTASPEKTLSLTVLLQGHASISTEVHDAYACEDSLRESMDGWSLVSRAKYLAAPVEAARLETLHKETEESKGVVSI